MESSPGDPLHDLIAKAAYWAQSISESGGGVPGMAIYSNMAPSPGDSLQTLAAKLVYWLSAISAGGGGGGGGTIQVYTSAAPPAAPADPTKGALWYSNAPGGGGLKEWVITDGAWE